VSLQGSWDYIINARGVALASRLEACLTLSGEYHNTAAFHYGFCKTAKTRFTACRCNYGGRIEPLCVETMLPIGQLWTRPIPLPYIINARGDALASRFEACLTLSGEDPTYTTTQNCVDATQHVSTKLSKEGQWGPFQGSWDYIIHDRGDALASRFEACLTLSGEYHTTAAFTTDTAKQLNGGLQLADSWITAYRFLDYSEGLAVVLAPYFEK
jgi:hypothetical protein